MDVYTTLLYHWTLYWHSLVRTCAHDPSSRSTADGRHGSCLCFSSRFPLRPDPISWSRCWDTRFTRCLFFVRRDGRYCRRRTSRSTTRRWAATDVRCIRHHHKPVSKSVGGPNPEATASGEYGSHVSALLTNGTGVRSVLVHRVRRGLHGVVADIFRNVWRRSCGSPWDDVAPVWSAAKLVLVAVVRDAIRARPIWMDIWIFSNCSHLQGATDTRPRGIPEWMVRTSWGCVTDACQPSETLDRRYWWWWAVRPRWTHKPILYELTFGWLPLSWHIHLPPGACSS